MPQRILLAGVLPFVSAFLGGLLAFGLSTRSVAEAQEAGFRREQVTITELLLLLDRNGAVRATLGTTPEGTTTFSLLGPDGQIRTRLAVDEGGGVLRFGTDDQPVLTIGELGSEVAGLVLRDYGNNFAAFLQATPGGQVAFILPHVILEGYTPDPARPQVSFIDQQGTRRLSLGLAADDTPTVRVTDASGDEIWSAP